MAGIVLLLPLLFLFVVMLRRQLEVPEEGTLSMVFDCIMQQTYTGTKADDTNRREQSNWEWERERE